MRRLAIVTGLAVAAVAVAAVAIWWFWLRSDPPSEAALPDRPTVTTAGGTTAAQDAGGTWEVAGGDGVFVGYRVQELLAGDAVKNTAVGRTAQVTGTLTIDGDEVLAAEVSADLRGLASDQARRDNFIRGNALETDRFPEAVFTLAEPVRLAGPPALGEEIAVTAVGDLTVHGVTRRVEIALDARWNGDTIDVAGSLPIVFADHGIEAPNLAFVRVDDRGEMELQLTFRRVGAT